MKAISYQGPRKMSVSSHSKPKIKKPTDALLRVTTTGICGSDLHYFKDGGIGALAVVEPFVPGHEFGAIFAKTSRNAAFRGAHWSRSTPTFELRALRDTPVHTAVPRRGM